MSLIKSVIYHILDSPSVDIQYIGPEGNISALGYASADILPSGPIYCISTSGGPIYIIYPTSTAIGMIKRNQEIQISERS
jgi:hypothetical protein